MGFHVIYDTDMYANHEPEPSNRIPRSRGPRFGRQIYRMQFHEGIMTSGPLFEASHDCLVNGCVQSRGEKDTREIWPRA